MSAMRFPQKKKTWNNSWNIERTEEWGKGRRKREGEGGENEVRGREKERGGLGETTALSGDGENEERGNEESDDNQICRAKQNCRNCKFYENDFLIHLEGGIYAPFVHKILRL